MTKEIVIAVVNHKGGVGKTATVENLAMQFVGLNQRTLCIDLDPQANLSRRCGVTPETYTIGDVLMGRATLAKAAEISRFDFCVVPSDIRLEETSVAIQNKSPNHVFLLDAIEQNSQAQIDVVLIDCPPAADILTINALIAATHVIIVADPEADAIEGMRRMVTLSAQLRKKARMAPVEILGAIINRANEKTVGHQKAISIIEAEIPVLGIVPLRQGISAAREIAQSFQSIATKIIAHLGGQQNA